MKYYRRKIYNNTYYIRFYIIDNQMYIIHKGSKNICEISLICDIINPDRRLIKISEHYNKDCSKLIREVYNKKDWTLDTSNWWSYEHYSLLLNLKREIIREDKLNNFLNEN